MGEDQQESFRELNDKCKIRVEIISAENVWLLESGDGEKSKAAVSIILPTRSRDKEEHLFESEAFPAATSEPMHQENPADIGAARKDEAKKGGKPGVGTGPSVHANYQMAFCKEFERKADWPFLHTLTVEPMIVLLHWVSPTGAVKSTAGTCHVDLGPLLRVEKLDVTGGLQAPQEEDAQNKGKGGTAKKDTGKKGGEVAPGLLEGALMKLVISTGSPLLTQADRAEAVDFEIKSFTAKNIPPKLSEYKEKLSDDPFVYNVKFEFPGFVGSWWDSVTGIPEEEKLSLLYGTGTAGVVEISPKATGVDGSWSSDTNPDASTDSSPTEREPKISWKSSYKRFLPSEAVIELKKKVRRGYKFYGEVSRCIKDGRTDLFDPCFKNYHSGLWLDLSPLIEEGVTEATLSCPLQDCRTDGKQLLSESNRTVDLKKTAPVEQIDPALPDKNYWKESQSVLVFHVKTSQPLEPVWSPPPEPKILISDVIPPRPKRQKIYNASELAIQQFNKFIVVAAKTISRSYFQLVNQRKAGIESPDCLARVEHIEEMRKLLSKELHRLGAWEDIKEKLKSHVMKIASEKFKFKSQDGDKFVFCNTIYVQLMEEIQLTISHLFTEKRKIDRDLPETIYTHELLKQLADEYEIDGDFRSADKFHLDRLLGKEPKCPNTWFQYGSFLMRLKNKDHGKAEECFREAINLYREHLPSLLALGCLLWHRKIYGHAESIIRHAIALNPQEEFVLWAILARVHFSKSERIEFLCCRRRAEVLFNEIIAFSDHSPLLSMDSAQFPFSPTTFTLRNAMSNSPFVQAALCLLDLNLPTEAHELLMLEDDVFTCTVEYKLSLAIVAEQKGDWMESERIFKEALNLEYEDEKTWCLLAHLRYCRGQYEKSLKAYLKTMQYSKAGDLYDYAYIELGNIYIKLGDFEKARQTFLKGAVMFPCSTMWLGSGVAFYNLRDMVNAEKVLIEGNLLDSQNFKIWAYLSLVCISTSRMEEAEFALTHSLRNIKDARLLYKVGLAFASKRNYRYAEIALTESLKEENNLNVRFHLADALYQQGKANDLYC